MSIIKVCSSEQQEDLKSSESPCTGANIHVCHSTTKGKKLTEVAIAITELASWQDQVPLVNSSVSIS